jgi:signal transduction histidine kinase
MKRISRVPLFGKIGRRLLRWFTIIALIPLIFMGYQGYYFAKQAVRSEVFLHMETVATRQRMQIDHWFEERVSDLEVLAAHPHVVRNCVLLEKSKDASLAHELIGILRSYQRGSTAYENLCIYGMNAQLIACAAESAITDREFGMTALFREVLESSGPVKSPVYLQEGVGPAMHMGTLIRTPAGNPTAIAIILLALSKTLDPIILDTSGLGSTGQAYLVDTAKVMLTPSRFMEHPEPLTHTMDTEGIRRALKGTSGAAVYAGYDGQQVLGAWVFMPEQQWALIAEMDADEAFAPLARLRRNAIIVALVVLVAIIAVVSLISRSISMPIHQLAEASLDVSRGNLDRTVVIRLRDEIGELAERFNHMVHAMKESRDSLQDAYERLVRTQEQLVQSERLAAIGEFVASIVHEIRNPLSAVKMNLRILETKCEKEGIVAEHFQLAKSQTERLESMLSDLLGYSKPIALARRPVVLGEFVDQIVRHVQTQEEELGIHVGTSVHAPAKILHMDPERMNQVVLNVLLNAVQAVERGGDVRLETADAVEGGQPAVEIAVSDNGHGVSPENLERLFEPFFTTRKDGTGLGLPTSKKIVDAHGGVIRVSSRIGEGTEVKIIIPIGK